MDKKRKFFGSNSIIIAIAVMVGANIILGATMMHLSKKAMRTQITQRMLDIANTAAYMLDGDDMRSLTKDDRGSRAYEDGMTILRSFQQNIDLAYIYAINPEPDGTFTFSIDPTIEDPGEFGSPIVKTDALVSASNGISAVDETPYEDAWGKFYSAYAPVFDSDLKVAAIVAVDFHAEWFQQQITIQFAAIVVITLILLAIGILFAMKLSAYYRARFNILSDEMRQLDAGFRELNQLMVKHSVKRMEQQPENQNADAIKALASCEEITDGRNDEFAEIGDNLHLIQKDLKRYISYVHSLTFTDTLTGVGNRAAYQRRIDEIDTMIKEDARDFCIVFFDLNGLEKINAECGFAVGDEMLGAAGTLTKKVFGSERVFRIASDEFIVILPEKTPEDLEMYYNTFDQELKLYNRENPQQPALAVSRGASFFAEGKDKCYRDVCIRAEEAMRSAKQAYYDSLK